MTLLEERGPSSSLSRARGYLGHQGVGEADHRTRTSVSIRVSSTIGNRSTTTDVQITNFTY